MGTVRKITMMMISMGMGLSMLMVCLRFQSLDPNSVANAAPNSPDLSSTSVLENQTIGSTVGQLIAHDGHQCYALIQFC